MSTARQLHISVLIPVYNGADTIRETIDSVLRQSYESFEIIVQDNDSNDGTDKIVASFTDYRIKYFRNPSNLGYPGNLNAGVKNCRGDIVYLLGADDLLIHKALENTARAFATHPEAGVVTRPYFWFENDYSKAVRVTKKSGSHRDELVSIQDPFDRVRYCFDNEILGQLSGLAMRRELIDTPFHEDQWVSHGYPWAFIFKKHPAVILSDYQLAVRIGMNEVRKKSSIYDRSPVERWLEFFEIVLNDNEFATLKTKCIKEIVARNYVGLVQIRNFGGFANCLKEIRLLVSLRPTNLLSPSFWFYTLLTVFFPPVILLPMSDWYKRHKHRDIAIDSSLFHCE